MPIQAYPISDSPLAMTIGGNLLINATHISRDRGEDPKALLRAALATGRPVFIGIKATSAEQSAAITGLDDAAAEVVALTYRERG